MPGPRAGPTGPRENETMTTTEKKIRAMLADLEPSEPQNKILAYLKAHDGKKLTARDLPALKEIDPTIRFYTIAGMHHIEWGAYTRTEGHAGGSLLTAYTTGAPTIDAAFVEKHNLAWFAASVERNEERRKALADDATIKRAATAVDALHKAQATIKELTDYGCPLAVVQHKIRDLIEGKAARS